MRCCRHSAKSRITAAAGAIIVNGEIMQKYFSFFILVCLAFLMSCAQAAAPPSAVNAANSGSSAARDTHEDDAPRITLVDAKKDFDDNSAVFIDTRSAEVFKKEHITGAINISAGDLAAKADTIPKGKKIIAYCS